MRSPLSLLLLLAVCGVSAVPAGLEAQAEASRVEYRMFGRAQLDIPGMTMVEIGLLGSGLDHLETRNPAVAPLASKFRMQRRTGLLLGAVAVVGGALAASRFGDVERADMRFGDPSTNLWMGAMGAFALSVVQLSAADRTLNILADRYGERP